MDRHLGGQFPYAAFFWPALAAMFLGYDADGNHAAHEPEGATPSKITLELQAVRLRDFIVVEGVVPTLLCTAALTCINAAAVRAGNLASD